jgi:phosphatidylinositol-3-phosphatase
MEGMARLVPLATALLVVAACAGPARPAAAPSSTPTASSAAAAPSASAAAVPGAHVFVVVMENRSFAEAMAQPYTARLAAQYAVATNYHAVAHPSLPNYLALTAGSTFGITDDDYHRLPPDGIGAELTAHGVPWRAYMEGMTRGCLDSPAPYSVKHNPFAYYGGCPANVVPLTALDGDLAGATPRFVWITPDLCHDGHDCSAGTADDFLAALVPRILGSAAWRDGGLLLLTWDEDDGGGSGNRVPAIVAAPGMTRHVTARPHDHYSLLATVEDRLGVPRLGASRQADPLSEVLP